jgi:hypothetical protein
MASIINAATSGGLVTTADTSGILQLQTAGTTAVTVDASQNVTLVGSLTATTGAFTGLSSTIGSNFATTSGNIGLGVAVPTKDVEVSGELRVQASATGGTGVGIEAFAAGGISYFTSYNRTTSAYAPASIIGSTVTITGDTTVSGTLKNSATISVGNATPSASGAGITFPATQSASSDANTLDDYEEGSWTPASSFTGGNGTRTDTVTGKYTKIGDMVYANFDILITKGTASGNLSVTGLPFARGGQDNRGGGVMFVYISMATLTNGLIAYIGDSQSSFTFFNGPNLSNVTAAGNLGTSSQFIGTVIYKV